MSEPVGISSSQRTESEPSQLNKPSLAHRLGQTKPLCPDRRVYHDHFARPIEAHYAGPAEPKARADLSHTLSRFGRDDEEIEGWRGLYSSCLVYNKKEKEYECLINTKC